jgi:hypothetical protein
LGLISVEHASRAGHRCRPGRGNLRVWPYLPGERIAIAVTTTQARGADPDTNVASAIMGRIGA